MAGYETLSVRSTGAAGDDGRPAVVLLHGFTQTAGSWEPVVEALVGRFRLLLPDAPGHGGSSHVRADLWATADLLARAWSSRSPAGDQTAAAWGGYSMGGRMALHVALAHPEVVGRLVLISTRPASRTRPTGRRAGKRT